MSQYRTFAYCACGVFRHTSSVQTLSELMAALRDPSQPLVIDLGGRTFTPTGPAVPPRGAPMVLKRSKSDTCPAALPYDHVALDSPPSEGLGCHSDSRYADEWRMDEEHSFSSSSAASVNAESSPSIDSPEVAHATIGQQRMAHRRNSRIASQAPHGRSRRFQRRRTDPEHHSAAATDTGFQPGVSGGPSSRRSQSSAEGHVSEDTGDDAHVAATAEFIEQVRTILDNAGDAAHNAMAAGQGPGDVEDNAIPAASVAPGRDDREGAVDDNQDESKKDYQQASPTLMFLDIVRPGTVICNGSIEVPQCASPQPRCLHNDACRNVLQ